MSFIIGKSIKVTKDLLLEPFLTGPLLLLILRGPAEARNTLMKVLANVRFIGDSPANLARTVKALKWLFAIGAASRVNQALNSLALNRWSLSRKGAPWNFDTGKEIVVITGGCSGFGALITRGLVGKARIVILDISDLPADMKSLPNVHYYKCDLASFDEIKKQAAAIKSEVGTPSVLINNAGIGHGSNILDSTPEWIDKIFRVNLISHWQLVQEFLPGMLKQKKGHIVSMASVASFIAAASMADYAATKAGLMAFHEALTNELGGRYENGDCIQTTIVHPTWARTPLVSDYADVLTAAGQAVIDPKLVSNAVIKQVLKGKSGGQILVPKSVGTIATIRSWPMWMQLYVGKATAKVTIPA